MNKKRMVFLILLIAVLILPAAVHADTAKVQISNIEKTAFGSGTIQPQKKPGIYAKLDADVLETLVSVGDTVSAGDMVMKLENETIESELYQAHYDMEIAQRELLYTKTHEQIKYRQVRDKDGDYRFDVNTGEPLMEKYSNEITIRAPCDGRLVAIYIEKGDDALAVFREKGAVMVISTDGRMKVALKRDEPMDLELGERVYVEGTNKNGKEYKIEGYVTSLTRRGLEAEIQIDSDLYPIDSVVKLSKRTGEPLGEGILEINRPMAVSAYGGTIKGVTNEFAIGSMVKRYDVLARIEWSELPLYIDNSLVLREFAKAKVIYDKAEEKLESLTAIAPCDGVVASIDVKEGDSVTDGALLMTIVDTGAGMTLSLSVDELDIPYVEPGQKVRVNADALPDVVLEGTVDRIAPLGNTENAVTTYEVFVKLTGETDARVKGGMNVTGEIVIGEANSVLTIPTDALRRNENGWYVTRSDGSDVQVELGIMNDNRVQIVSGLSEGETIVY